MNSRRRLAVTALIPFLAAISIGAQSRGIRVPINGFVPDSLTAMRVAEAVLEPVYGAALVQRERPFSAKLVKSTWIVRGGGVDEVPDSLRRAGGVAEVRIARRDGRIEYMSHGK